MATTVILGSGIIGVSTAYYLSLSQPGSSIHLVENSLELFASASGFAGGFISKDWFSSDVAELGALSFEEHKRLAEEFGGREKWGYGSSTGVSYTVGNPNKNGRRGDDWLRGGSRADAANEEAVVDGSARCPKWLRRSDGDGVEIISEEGSLAQVDPLRLCQFLLESCLERGVQLHHPAEALSIGRDTRNELSSIRILNKETNAESDIPCTKILIAAGVWSPKVFSTLFPTAKETLPISSVAGHSLVVRSPRWTKEHEEEGSHAVFSTDEEGFCPEIFSRYGGDIYVAGLNSSTLPFPNLATESNVDDSQIKKLQQTAKRLLGASDTSDDLEIVRKGLCFRPVTEKGTPIVSKIPDEVLGVVERRPGEDGGVWLAAGHGPWGISHSLGTGKVMAEMIQGKRTSVDVGDLELESYR